MTRGIAAVLRRRDSRMVSATSILPRGHVLGVLASTMPPAPQHEEYGCDDRRTPDNSSQREYGGSGLRLRVECGVPRDVCGKPFATDFKEVGTGGGGPGGAGGRGG